MGNQQIRRKCELTDKNLIVNELKLLQLSGLKLHQIQQFNVEVGTFKNEPVYIRTNICGDKNKPKLVWIHGYASSGPLFYKTIKIIAEYFCIIYIDMIGMGGSSRPDDFDKNELSADQAIQYFVDYIEKWRQQMSSLYSPDGVQEDFTNFYLAGHSFGGYLVGNYALQFPQHIKKLIMLSPIGIRERKKSEKPLDPLKRFEGRNGPKRWQQPFGKMIWKKKISPFTFYRVIGRNQTSLKLIGNYVQKRQKVEKDMEKQVVTDYMYQIFLRESTTDTALMVMFNVSLEAHMPLGTQHKFCNADLPFNFSFVYGDKDWTRIVDKDFAQECCRVNGRKYEDKSRFLIVPDSDHNMHMDNPQAFSHVVINDLLDLYGTTQELPVLKICEQTQNLNTINYYEQFIQETNSVMGKDSEDEMEEQKESQQVIKKEESKMIQ